MRRFPALGGPLVPQLALLAAVLWAVGAGRTGAAVGVTCAVFGWAVLIRALAAHSRQGLGPADHVTASRGTLACVVAALTADSALASGHRTTLVLLATLALSLDAVDGWVARRTRTASALGARMDMEVDAFLILVLSIAASSVLGPWVLMIGAFRYVLVVATWAAPWLGGSVAPSYWRKAIAALQGIVLTVATAQVLPHGVAAATVVVSLVLLAWSFGTQGAELWRVRASHLGGAVSGRARVLQPGRATDAGPAVQPVRVRP